MASISDRDAAQSALGAFRVIRPDEIEWRPFPAFPPAARLAILAGDPARPGPYVIRVRLPHDTKLMPHEHPEARVYTVVSGVFYIGLGEQFDPERLTAHGVGSVIVLPGGQRHFHWAKSGEYVTQVNASARAQLRRPRARSTAARLSPPPSESPVYRQSHSFDRNWLSA